MKTMKNLLLVSLLLVVIACDKQKNDDIIKGGHREFISLSTPEFLSIAFDGNNELSVEETQEILNDFFDVNETKSANSTSIIDYKYVVEMKRNRSITKSSEPEVEKIAFHRYNLNVATKSMDGEEDGFAIVCADRRFPNVIAYTKTGAIEAAKDNGAAIMLDRAQSTALMRIAEIKYYEDSLRESTTKKIKEDLYVSDFTLDEIVSKIFINDQDVTKGFKVTPSGNEVTTVGPLTSTAWGQNSPFNLYINLSGDDAEEFGSSYDGRYPTGCVVTCMAQVVAYLKPTVGNLSVTGPNGASFTGAFSWPTVLVSSRPVSNDKTSAQSKQLAALMKTIATGSGTTWGPDGGSTSTSNAITFLKNKWGISIDGKKGMNFANMKSSLDDLRIVVLTGACSEVTKAAITGRHAWIADGYLIRQKVTRQILKNYAVYCHCNFGWGGNWDGYYLFETDGSITFDIGYEWMGTWDSYAFDLHCYPNVRK
ncbi:MAG: C10 family peptidase [Dysgonamonadaceae bacterium]|jgi:hypothetical protein|nr:C10 family peptidase [Dysgonamonadaceae bacterium]